jgi:hypothetical protein
MCLTKFKKTDMRMTPKTPERARSKLETGSSYTKLRSRYRRHYLGSSDAQDP